MLSPWATPRDVRVSQSERDRVFPLRTHVDPTGLVSSTKPVYQTDNNEPDPFNIQADWEEANS